MSWWHLTEIQLENPLTDYILDSTKRRNILDQKWVVSPTLAVLSTTQGFRYARTNTMMTETRNLCGDGLNLVFIDVVAANASQDSAWRFKSPLTITMTPSSIQSRNGSPFDDIYNLSIAIKARV